MQTIMLLLGGFALASALSKHFIAKRLAVSILSRVGRKPHHVLLANMLVATFASMWISNVAAPVLCFSLVQPILKTLPHTHPFSKSLVLGIALASNLGGMTSPISSPQNIFAIERMSMSGRCAVWGARRSSLLLTNIHTLLCLVLHMQHLEEVCLALCTLLRHAHRLTPVPNNVLPQTLMTHSFKTVPQCTIIHSHTTLQ